MKMFTILLLYLFLTACATTGVKPGPDKDTYTLTVTAAEGGSLAANTRARTMAGKYCSDMDKVVKILDIQSTATSIYGSGSADVTFRCLAPDNRE